MPDTARVLKFRSRTYGAPSGPKTRVEAGKAAASYLELGAESRLDDVLSSYLNDADVLMSLCALLRERVNSAPSVVADEAGFGYGWVVERFASGGLFDEREFFAGEFALLAGMAHRLLGHRDETERWLDRAEANFRHTVSPAAHLARVAYTRLTLRYDARRHEDVLELISSTARTFAKLNMHSDLGKCQFLEAMSLKEVGRTEDAVDKLQELAAGPIGHSEPALKGLVLMNLGDIESAAGHFEMALKSYKEALPILQSERRFATLADLKGMVGETLRRMGQYSAALEAYREAARDHLRIGTTTRAAYLQIVVAETLLEAGRSAEAEFEIRAALPTIEREKMVPEGFAAIAILNESVRQRKRDPKALGELREYLQANN